MLTVGEVARRLGRNPETVRRWIRDGRLAAHKVGPRYVIQKGQLQGLLEDVELPLPPEWGRTATGEPMPNVVRALRLSRQGH